MLMKQEIASLSLLHQKLQVLTLSPGLTFYLLFSLSLLPPFSLSSLKVLLQEFVSTIDYLHVLLCTFLGQTSHF